MIKLNFIPEQQRQHRSNLMAEDFAGVPGEVIAGSIVAFAGLLVAIHLMLAGVVVLKMASYGILEVHWNAMAADKKAYDEVSNEMKAIQAKMTTLRPITSAQDLHWAMFLNDLSDSMPKSVWLRQVLFDDGTLTIYGSSVSKVKNEMVEAGNFVATLKEKRSVKDNFTGVDVDSIQRRDSATVSIADFSLKARRK